MARMRFSYSEMARERREAEELWEVARAYGGTLPSDEEMRRTNEAIAEMWRDKREEVRRCR